jgi:hypothetical protein
VFSSQGIIFFLFDFIYLIVARSLIFPISVDSVYDLLSESPSMDKKFTKTFRVFYYQFLNNQDTQKYVDENAKIITVDMNER